MVAQASGGEGVGGGDMRGDLGEDPPAPQGARGQGHGGQADVEREIENVSVHIFCVKI